YRQGQRPDARSREYFYYIDHRGQLFLDDAKVKNFITCFKDPTFLSMFFRHLERNRSGRYEREFPFVSRCGRERNFLRCDDVPVVFTHLR
ncbi:CH082 protein, partial [Formicarius rufipectus]|nr:CH082 protein [Formicarius rufipectus]